MGLRYRKSFKVAPGVRVTERARGGVSTTVGVPGTGLSYTTSSSSRRLRGANARSVADAQAASAPRRQAVLVPMTRRIKIERMLCLIGLLSTLVGFVVVPLLIVALPCVLTGLIMMLLNIKDEMRWYRENEAAKAQHAG